MTPAATLEREVTGKSPLCMATFLARPLYATRHLLVHHLQLWKFFVLNLIFQINFQILILPFFILSFFLGSKNLFSNKILAPLFFMANNFHIFSIFKRFLNKQGFNPIIPNNGIYGINSCKNELGFGGGPTSNKFSLK